VFKFGGLPGLFSHLGFSFPSTNVFIHYTLRTMCNSSLRVWKNTMFICLFIFSCLFILNILKKKNVVAKFELNISCGLYFIGLFKVLNISCHYESESFGLLFG
jgi:hypothetical protein